MPDTSMSYRQYCHEPEILYDYAWARTTQNIVIILRISALQYNATRSPVVRSFKAPASLSAGVVEVQKQ
jgi:hypothetical protein